MVFENLLNPVLNPFLNLNPLLAIMIISFLLTLLVTLIYKWVTNQALMKSLKEEMQAHQKEMKEHRNDPKKMMAVQKKAMEKNMEYMMHSFKPMIVTLLPVLIVFGWLNAHMGYEPLQPDREFTTTAMFADNIQGSATLIAPEGVEIIGNAAQEIKENKAEWTLKGVAGEHLLEYQFEDKSFTKEILITNGKEYKEPQYNTKGDELKTIKINNQPKKMLNIFGWKIGWLGTYIIFSLIFSMGLRKILKVY